MTIRLQEVHPMLVHVPIAFAPVAIGADLAGTVAGNRSLNAFGRGAIAVAAAGALASGITGLIAGEEVNVEGKSRDMLMTHRNLNFLATVALGCLALWRARRQKPDAAYLALGAAITGVLGYTAYLGGSMISDYGVGVEPAGGVYRPDAPAIGSASIGEVASAAATDLVHGVEHMVEEVGQGKIVPALAGASGDAASKQPPQDAQSAENAGARAPAELAS